MDRYTPNSFILRVLYGSDRTLGKLLKWYPVFSNSNNIKLQKHQSFIPPHHPFPTSHFPNLAIAYTTTRQPIRTPLPPYTYKPKHHPPTPASPFFPPPLPVVSLRSQCGWPFSDYPNHRPHIARTPLKPLPESYQTNPASLHPKVSSPRHALLNSTLLAGAFRLL